MTPIGRALLPLVVAMLATAAMLAQAPQTVFRAGVEIVHLDVSVLDRDRRPVRGLTRDDFTLLEDGRPQTIAVFDVVEVARAPEAPREPAPWLTTAPLDVRTNEIARTPEGRLFVLLLDDGLLPADAAALDSARRIGRSAIDAMAPGDQMAVVYTVASRGAQNFTSDRAALRAAVERLQQGSGTHVFGWDNAVRDPKTGRWMLTTDSDTLHHLGALRTLESVAATLIAAPQRRKAIIYVSPGIPLDPAAAALPVLAGSGSQMAIREGYRSVAAALPRLFDRLQHANVTIYAVDPMGLGGLSAYVQQRASGLRAIAEATQPLGATDDWLNPPRPPLAMDLGRHLGRLSLEFLRTAAENTGGVAVVDTNDFSSGVARIFEENAHYYLLGFSPSRSHRPGALHRLEVRVNREGVRVRTRSGYATPAPESGVDADRNVDRTAGKSATAALTRALAGPVPTGALPLRASAAPFALPGADRAAVIVTVGVIDGGGDGEQPFEMQVRAFSMDGADRGSISQAGRIARRASASAADAALDLLARIDLPRGRHELRVATRLEPASDASSVFVEVDVPDFAGAPVSLSGVLIAPPSPGHAGPLSVIDSLVSVVPTSRREFALGENVIAFVRLYQGGRDALTPATLQITLQDAHDRVIYNYPHRLAASRFDAKTRHTDVNFTVPMNAMQPGPHLLTFDARVGDHAARRQVRFTVKQRRPPAPDAPAPADRRPPSR